MGLLTQFVKTRRATDAPESISEALLNTRRFRILGLSGDQIIRYFFQGNAAVAILVLALILVFLFREGAGFFDQNLGNLRVYRLAGLEYVDFIKGEIGSHTVLVRRTSALRLKCSNALLGEGMSVAEVNAKLAGFDRFAEALSDAAEEVRGTASDLTELASGIKQKEQIFHDMLQRRAMLLSAKKAQEAAAVVAQPVDFSKEVAVLRGTFPAYQQANQLFGAKLRQAVAQEGAASPVPRFSGELEELKRAINAFAETFPSIEAQMQSWRHDAPIPWYSSVSAFLFGRQWITASFWQDFYGIVPLVVGSVLVSVIALAIAVPFGLATAIYVSEFAGPTQKNLIKPAIEFISAIPSVVLGFLGVAVLGQALRALSQLPSLSWFPGFPMSERLNALTAGTLLAFMAIPTIFSLAEDALNNVPKHFKEASYALGATRLQTIVRILVPASLSGILSAILLGFGRVIGETMVVLLCAGNRIVIPDFTQGLGAFFQPVHTMTGIIAQEMGEVGPGTIHYRALFMVGLLLFFLALGINFLAQRMVQRYRISIG